MNEIGFSKESVMAVDGDWSSVSEINNVLERLRGRRRTEVRRTGVLAKSKVAWKVVVFQQTTLYRIVMLADGCAVMWNARNTLGSLLCARALFESVAMVWDFDKQVERFCEEENLKGVDDLVMNRTFATRLSRLYEKAESTKSVNVLGFIDKFDGLIAGAREHYDDLSEYCHPNSIGNHLMFSDLDVESEVVALSETRRFERGVFDHVFGVFAALGLVELSLDEIDSFVPIIARLNVPRG